MEEIWRTRDHLGRVVVLTSAGRDHIRVRHDELAARLDEVKAVVERPDFVTRDRQRAHRECFYRRYLSGPLYIKVVVHYRPAPPRGTWEGKIITAYSVEELEPEEARLWP